MQYESASFVYRYLQSDNSPICSGAVYTPRIVLTVAHCTQESRALELSVRAGLRISILDASVFQVVKKIEHPGKNECFGDVSLGTAKICK
jgi:secreted trypsin-like serine protease